MSLKHKKCHLIQYGNLAIPQLLASVGSHVPVFRQLQIKDHAKYLGVEIGSDAAESQMDQARNRFVCVCARIRTSSQSLVQRLVSFNIYALSVLSFIGSVADVACNAVLHSLHSVSFSMQSTAQRSPQNSCCFQSVVSFQKERTVFFHARSVYRDLTR